MSAIVKGQKARNIVLLAAGGLLLLALILSLSLGERDELKKITAMLAGFGYTVYDDQLYIAGDFRNATIAELLSDVDLASAVEASRAAGFPSDVQRRGDVVLILAATREEEIITLYALDGEMELCFIQTPNTDAVKPLGGKA